MGDIMRKLLLGTTALAMAGAAGAAQAAKWDVRVGGYYNAMVAYATTDYSFSSGRIAFPVSPTADFDGVDVSTNAEIFFLPSITLDNGIKIGANIQLEGEQSTDQIDESYVFIKGSFGEILLGSENSAGYKMHYAAPNAAIIAFNSPSTPDYIAWTLGAPGVFRGPLGSTYLEVGGNNDAKRISYFTPRFAGFQLGVSYAHDANQDNFGPTDLNNGNGGDGTLGHIFDVGANYVRSFGDFRVAISGRYGTGELNNCDCAAGDSANPTVWSAGVNIGYGGFTIGGSIADADEHVFGILGGTAFDLGVSYATGPWTFSLTWFHGELGGSFEGSTTNVEQDTIGFGIDYKLAKGVRLNLFGAYVDLEATVHVDAATHMRHTNHFT